ncbi:MAG: PKD domain-containing protein [Candidatus Latescibacter sp.]|nr:PKD domain-containing protein [Candidatus Latescibacter sp.]
MIFRLAIAVLVLSVFGYTIVQALERPDVEFKIFQFPSDRIPCIDGKTDDWNIVPESYTIGSDQLRDTDLGNVGSPDPKDLNVNVKVGWVKGMNRLYFLYEADDNYWSMFYRRGDIFEVAVDGDLSGGQFISNPQLPDPMENHFRFKGVHSQNYHIFTPPGEGRDWAMVWGCQPWIRDLPYANHAYSYNFKEGESGHLILEFWITPFDYAPYDGPDGAVESKLEENRIIGLSWAVMDYDKAEGDYTGFWNLSHKTRMDSNASCQVAFRPMPLEPQFRKPIEAQWSFKVVDMDRRLVAFKDLSYGKITSWLWYFDDGTTSTEQHPIHQYSKAGEYVVVLNVEGPAGKARRIKVRDVVVK